MHLLVTLQLSQSKLLDFAHQLLLARLVDNLFITTTGVVIARIHEVIDRVQRAVVGGVCGSARVSGVSGGFLCQLTRLSTVAYCGNVRNIINSTINTTTTHSTHTTISSANSRYTTRTGEHRVNGGPDGTVDALFERVALGQLRACLLLRLL